MTIPDRRLLYALVGWTLFVWVSRIRNVVTDDELSGGGKTGRIIVSVVFIAGAVALVLIRRSTPERLAPALKAFAVWTIGYWLIRGTGILLADHDGGFKAVHTVLAAVSIALALANWPQRRFAVAGAHE